MTAFASDELTVRAKSAGFVEVLHEPFRDHAPVTAQPGIVAFGWPDRL